MDGMLQAPDPSQTPDPSQNQVQQSSQAQQPDAANQFLQNNPNIWQNLMNFGASGLAASGQRNAQGFLQYPGMAMIGQGILGSEQQAQARTRNQALNYETMQQGGLLGAQTQAAQLQNQFTKLYLNRMQDPQFQQALTNIPENGMMGAGTNSTPQTSVPGGSNTGLVNTESQILGQQESGGNYKAENSQGYLGKYQLGAAALNTAQINGTPIYQPAPGENLKNNEWKGTINIPPYGSMTAQQFLQHPQAQEMAFQAHIQSDATQMNKMGLTQYDGQTIGGVPITPATRLAMSHLGGPTGVKNFLQSNGQYDPADSNHTRISDSGLGAATQLGLLTNQQQLTGAQQGQNQGLSMQQLTYLTKQYREQAATFGNMGPFWKDKADRASRTADELEKMAASGAVAGAQKSAQYPYEQALQNQAIINKAATEGHGPQGQFFPNSVADPTYAGQIEYQKGMGAFLPKVLAERAQPREVRGPGGAVVNPEVNVKTPYGAVHLPQSIIQSPDRIEVTDKQGNKYWAFVNPMPGANDQKMLPAGTRVVNGIDFSQMPGLAGVAPADISPQQKSEQDETGIEAAKDKGEIAEDAMHAATAQASMKALLNSASQINTGRWAGFAAEAKSQLQAVANTLGYKTPVLDRDLGNYQAASGLFRSLSREAMAGTGERSNYEFQAAEASQPNPGQTAVGMQLLAAPVMAKNDWFNARNAYFTEYMKQHTIFNPNEFQNEFNNLVTPMGFWGLRLYQTPEGKAAFLKTMSNMLRNGQKSQAQAIVNDINAAKRFFQP